MNGYHGSLIDKLQGMENLHLLLPFDGEVVNKTYTKLQFDKFIHSIFHEMMIQQHSYLHFVQLELFDESILAYVGSYFCLVVACAIFYLNIMENYRPLVENGWNLYISN